MAEKSQLPPNSHQQLLNQQLVTAQQPMITAQQPMVTAQQPLMSAQQPGMMMQPQPMVIQVRKPPPRRYDHYEKSRSRVMGIIQITCGIMAIIINAIGIALNERASQKVRDYHNPPGRSYNYDDRSYGSYYWEQTNGYLGSAGFWCPPMFFVCGAFAMVAARRPTKCPVITCLVLGILSSVFCSIMIAMASFSLSDDANRLEEGFSYEKHTSLWRNSTYNYGVPDPPPEILYNPVAASWAKRVLVVSVLYFCVSLVEMVASIWVTVIAGKALSVEDPEQESREQLSGVQYMANSPQAGQLIILDRHGRPIPDAQVIQVPGPSMISGTPHVTQTGSHMVNPAVQMATLSNQVAPSAQGQGQPDTSEPTRPPSYTATDSQDQAKSVDDSPPPPYT